MDFSVVFSPTSIRDLAESVTYIARHDPEAAARIGNAIIDAAEKLLSTQPFAGPRCAEYDEAHIRYWLHQGYRIVYEVSESDVRIDILRVWNCSRGDWPIDLNN
ncbi:MAG: plasmid stabilization system protein ParE [Limisphaerales bacterium]|jgi:plasmid stabilization system protein ParE